MRWRLLVPALLVAVAGACSGAGGTDAASNPTTTTTRRRPPAINPGAPAADPDAPARIVTPGENVPNPFVLVEDGTYFVYSTQESWDLPNVPLRSGPSMDDLGPPSEVLPELPAWVQHGLTWAPDVRRVGDTYVLWYTAALLGKRPGAVNHTQCIGAAVASRPEGPFVPVGDEPQVCQLDRWGSIDPRTFLDGDGTLWLHWKSDDNAQLEADTTSSIYARRLAADGVTLVGEPVRILEVDRAWEGRIVEAPQLIEEDGRHWLFYSGNWFNQPAYGIGWAECEGPAGPCRKPPEGPWLGSNAQGEGPGESSLFRDEAGWWIVYSPKAVLFETDTPRPVAMAAVELGPEGPYLADR